MSVAMFLISFALTILVLFMGMFVSAKLTGFSIAPANLLMVVVVSTLAGTVPAFGLLLSLIVMYVLLKRFSDGQGIIFMMICSGVITAFLGASMADTITRMGLQL